MINIKRTSAKGSDFRLLTKLLDQELLNIYKDEQAKFDEHNILENEVKTIVIYDEEIPIACGAFKEYKNDTKVEIKRMYVNEKYRTKGIGKLILLELEKWAAELNFKTAILELGNNQPAALKLYESLGYSEIPKFPPYENMHDSICMKKEIK